MTPKPYLANLHMLATCDDFSVRNLSQEISKDLPSTVFVSTRMDWPGTTSVKEAVLDTDLYQAVTHIPENKDRHYGAFGGTLYTYKFQDASLKPDRALMDDPSIICGNKSKLDAK